VICLFRAKLWLVLVFIALGAVTATPRPSHRREHRQIKEIRITGLKRYSPEEVLPVSGFIRGPDRHRGRPEGSH